MTTLQTTQPNVQTLSAQTIRHLMLTHHLTIRGIARQWNLSLKRVRQVRQCGVQGNAFVQDWIEILTGNRDQTERSSA